MSRYPIHPDFQKYEFTKVPLYPALLPAVQKAMTIGLARTPVPDGLSVREEAADGRVPVTVFAPAGLAAPAPCLVYFHGGAFALKAAPCHKRLACHYALETPCKVVFVDYRLLPRHPFPAGFEDCLAAYRWVVEQAQALGVDPTRIAVGGDSAGGALAARVCLAARDTGLPAPCFQLLMYPATDARMDTASMRAYPDTPMWNARLNRKMWKLYLKNGDGGRRAYASPLEAASFAGLPPTFVEVAQFDCLRDEGLALAHALEQAGVPVETREVPGTIHGYDIALDSAVTQDSVARRLAALRRAFARREEG